MSIYSRYVFPRLCDFFLNRPAVNRLRRELLAHAMGEVLELGFGTGLNLPCYPTDVRNITAIEPNVGMHPLAARRISKSHLNVVRCAANAERLPFADASFETVVSTFTLCSVADSLLAVRELFRVLKKEGQFLFLEHGRSPEERVRVWQHRLNWLEGCLGDGCQLDRDFDSIVASQPFSKTTIDHGYLEGIPKTHGYLFQGIAIK